MSDENDKLKQDSPKINTIHTLESDLASVIRDKDYGKNIVKIITDPSKKQIDNQIISDSYFFRNKSKLILLLIISFVVITVSTLLIFLIKPEIKNTSMEVDNISTSTDRENEVLNIDNILKTELIQYSDFSKINKFEIISELSKIKKSLNEKNITPMNNVGINTNINVIEFFQKIRYSGPESFIRSLNNKDYVFGIYSLEKERFETYLLIKVENFDLSFKSILEWEKYMPDDLKDIFIGNNEIIKDINTGTSTDLNNLQKEYFKKNTNKIFVDRILKNHDIREYVDNENNINLIYGFINNKYLLITSGEISFIDIKDRLLKDNIAR